MKTASIGLCFILALSPAFSIAEGKDGVYMGGSFNRTDLDVSSDNKAFLSPMWATYSKADGTGWKDGVAAAYLL